MNFCDGSVNFSTSAKAEPEVSTIKKPNRSAVRPRKDNARGLTGGGWPGNCLIRLNIVPKNAKIAPNNAENAERYLHPVV